ncbi:MAG: biotin/lipoyl-binding protein [Nigerium sp.]|nr:biotin/lipoyl-binding protein [Nigerium sp.]
MQRRTGLIAAVAGVLAIGLVSWALWPRPAAAAYVTAPAARASITQTLTLVGPVTRTDQAAASFGTDGLVTTVSVRVGDHVTAGQQLATIDPAPLRVSVLRARADVATAQAQLDANLTTQRNGTSGGSGAGLGGASGLGGGTGGLGGLGGVNLSGALGGQSSGATPTASAPAGTTGQAGAGGQGGAGSQAGTGTPAYLAGMEQSLAALQQSVALQQEKCTPVFAALSQLQGLGQTMPTALPTTLPTTLPTSVPTARSDAAPARSTPRPALSPTTAATPASVSASATALPSASASPSASAPVSPSATTTPSPEASPRPTTAKPTSSPSASVPGIPDELLGQLAGMAGQVQACSDAMMGVALAEATAGQAIATAAEGLAASSQQAAAALAAAQAEVERAAREASEQVMREAQAQLAAQLAGMGGAVTDATIASNRAQLLQARQQLDTAETNLAEATLVSPITGTVGALDLTAGESSAGRSATIVGEGAAQIVVQVPLSHRALVAPGVGAQVGNLAAPPELAGHVNQVSVMPTGQGSPTFATEVLADDPDGSLFSGAYAEVTLQLAQAYGVLTVPASAVTKLTDTTATVEVVANARDDAAGTVTVVTGRAGQGRVEIVSGLRDGQLVVLADRRLPVPGGISQYQPASHTASPTPSR